MNENKKTIIRLALGPKEMRKLDDVCEKRGMTQISAVSRMVMWLARQDHDIQTDILSLGSDDSSDTKRLKLLKRIAGQSAK
jgi:hypothetical protein